jgi:hypothetical protein
MQSFTHYIVLVIMTLKFVDRQLAGTYDRAGIRSPIRGDQLTMVGEEGEKNAGRR